MRTHLSTLGLGLGLGLCLSLAGGCPSTQPAPQPRGKLETDDRPSDKTAPGKEVKTVALPKSMVIGKNVTLSGFYEDEALPEEGGKGEVGDRPNAGGVGDRPNDSGKTGGAETQNLYKIVAPATVIVRTERGYGTGLIYDPAGWILTNHHVVAHARREDFRWRVDIGLGTLSRAGVMEQEEKTYKAYVHKVDPLRDLAVVKLVDPPKRLVPVRISAKDPIPGQHVTSIGHAGIGLLWAIKDGQIAAIGKLSKHLAQLQLYEASRDKEPPDAADDASAAQLAQLKAKQLEELRKYLETKVPALVIQSTCDISQGDSGGPLVNDRAEVVGLNAFVRSAGMSRKESNFHIHAAELRKFIKQVPADAPQILPDPWHEGGSLAKLGDADLDSTVDVLAMYQVVSFRFFQRTNPTAYFVDLDQDSFKGLEDLPEVKEVVDKRSFDAELIFLAHGGYLHAWYDTDADGKPDVLLVAPDRHGARGKVKAYRINAAGKLSKDASLAAGTLIRPALFADATMARRLTGLGSKIFSTDLLPPEARGGTSYPDPIASVGHTGKLKDADRDGKPDTIEAAGLFSSGFIFDVDQDSIGGLKVDDSAHRALKAHTIDAELSWININRDHWAWYDTNNDGRFDLLLKAGTYPGDIVAQAWQVGADGKYVEDRAHVGQYMIQPELLRSGDQATRLRALVTRVLAGSRAATGPGIKAFPDPTDYYRFGYSLRSVKRYKDVAAQVRTTSRCTATLVDVDQDSPRRARKAKKTVLDLVKEGAFDAEFARMDCNNEAWTFYDTQGKGSFDLVLYSAYRGKGKPTAAYQVDPKGQITPLARAIGCEGLTFSGLFKNPRLKTSFAKIADALFSDSKTSCKP